MSSFKRFTRLALAGTMAAAVSLSGASALYTGVIDASDLNLRATPGGTSVGTVPFGTKVAVISNSSDWYKIAVNGNTYYASSYYIDWTEDCDFNIGVGTIQCETTVNFRSKPSTSSSVLDSLSNGQKVNLIGIEDGWYKASVNGVNGYIHVDYVNVNGGVTADKNNVVGSTVSSSTSDETRQAILDFAAQFVGTPYVYGGSTPSGFDCSGFTSYVYKNVATPIARTSSQQRETTTNIPMEELLPGDLVFFGSNDVVSHVGIYVGNGMFIHSPHTGSVVKYDTLASGNYNLRFICGGRVL